MKDLIRKILKEDNTDRFMQYVIDNIPKFNVKNIKDAVNIFGLTPYIQEEFRKKAFDKLIQLEGTSFNTDDYYDGEFGTYSFKFTIDRVRDYDSFEEIVLDVLFLNEGHLEVDGIDYDLEEGTLHDDFGWEVDMEINGVIAGVLRKEVTELLFVPFISVEEKWFYER